MAIKALNPYLFFNGDAAEAIQLYEKVLGAKTEGLMRMGDMAGPPVPPEHRNRVVHALLHLGPGAVMISDAPPDQPMGRDSNVQVTLDFDDVGEMTRKFEALAQGGKVDMPLQDTFWGARFGALTDRHGIHWMFNCALKKS